MNRPLPKTLWPFLWHFLKKQPVAFTIFAIAPMTIVLEANVIPYMLKIIIDGMSNPINGDKAATLKAIAPALYMGSAAWIGMVVFFRLQNWWQAYIVPKFEFHIRSAALDYITQHSQQYFANRLSGSLANKIADLPKALETIRMILCWNCITTFSVVTVSLILLTTVSLKFPLILGLWVVIHLTGVIYFSSIVYRASETNADDKTIVTGAVVDTIANITSMKIFARRQYELGYIRQKQFMEQSSNKRLILAMNNLRLFMDIPVTIMLGVMVYYMITGWQQGTVSTGEAVFIFNTCWAVTFHMWFLGHALTDLFREIGIAKQALAVINEPHELTDVPDAKPLVVTQGEVAFDNVTFFYRRNANIFENKSVILNAGQKVGLVGFSGSGKTTFVHLIMRFYDVASGHITIDGQDIAQVTQDSLHEHIAMIPQDTSLFHRSLMDNIRYGKPDATDAEVIEAAKKAHCHEFITQLPEGYQALVGERGIKLSGGQRQRIAIARAILKNAPIIILDEATSALDSVTEKLIQDSLHELMQGRTTIVIAHRLSTLGEMDRILVFDKGHIIEDGTHKSLLKKKGHYARMWNMQAGGFLPESAE